MKKILHISKFYYPYAGGIEDVCYNIVKLFNCDKQYEQQVFCFNDNSQTISDIHENIPVHRVGVSCVIASQPIPNKYRSELKSVIESFKPDVVHFHAPNPLAAYFLLDLLPRCVTLIIHWHSDIVAQSVIYQFIKPIETNLLKRADRIIATSPNYIDGSSQLQRFSDKVIVIQNVICPTKFELNNTCEQQITQIKNRYNNKPIVLFVGRHVSYKGLKYLIKAAPLIQSECKIIIGGIGPISEELKQKNKSDKVQFVGRIDDDLLPAYYHAADVFVFPSITRNEAFGVSLAEAMYCQTPAVTFTIDGSGVNYVNINNQTGLEVENSNHNALAKAIDNLLEDKVLCGKLSVQAKQRVDSLFVIDKIKDEIYKLYESSAILK